MARLLTGLQERGHVVRFFCGRGVVARPAARFGLETRPLHVGGDAALHHAFRISRALRSFQADVLIAGTFRKLLHLARGARRAGVPVVARVGLESDVPRSAKYRFLFRHRVARIVTNADDLRAAYLSVLPDLDPERVVTIHKGVSEPRLPARTEARARFGLPRNAFVVAALARLVEQKRLDRFVEVLARCPDGVHGVVAGDGPLRADLERLARPLGARLRFVGHLDDPAAVLAASDALLVTSDRESLANAMLEALAAGLPVISTPVSGAREALSSPDGSDTAGLVTNAFTVEALAAELDRLRRDPALRARLAEGARETARTRFSPERMLDGWEDLLREVTAER